MARERTQSGKFGEWSRISATVRANSADLPQLEDSVARLDALLVQGVDLTKEQGAFRASKQDRSQQLQVVLDEGTRLVTFLRAAIKQRYGHTSEKLAEFGMQPFRGRKVKQVPPSEPAPGPEIAPKPPGGAG